MHCSSFFALKTREYGSNGTIPTHAIPYFLFNFYWKGYSRLGAALSFLGRHDEAEKAYTKGLQLDPNNAQLKSGLEDAKAQAARK